MKKSTLLIVLYSLVLIALFSTFCYLMTTVNPVPVKQDPPGGRKFGSDDVLYPDDVIIPHDNVAFGLEKVNDYNTISTKRPDKYVATLPTLKYVSGNARIIGLNEDFQMKPTNCTRSQEVDYYKMLTDPMKLSIKSFRRSIHSSPMGDDDQSNIDLNTPKSLVLKINNSDGKSKIEINALTEQGKNNVSELSRNYTVVKYDKQNNSVIKLEGTDALLIKIIGNITKMQCS